MNNKRLGIILDYNITVGSFTHFTAEDSYGKRELKNIKINSIYFDVIQMTTNQALRFVYTENIPDKKLKIIDDFGSGILNGSSFVSDNDILLKKACFTRCPPQLKLV